MRCWVALYLLKGEQLMFEKYYNYDKVGIHLILTCCWTTGHFQGDCSPKHEWKQFFWQYTLLADLSMTDKNFAFILSFCLLTEALTVISFWSKKKFLYLYLWDIISFLSCKEATRDYVWLFFSLRLDSHDIFSHSPLQIV